MSCNLKPLGSLVLLSLAGSALAADVQIGNGTLAGSVQGSVFRFLGVPYAAPPVGLLRWQAPLAATNWTDVRPATEYGPNCMQTPYSESLPYYRPMKSVSEDCLYLNIWTDDLTGNRPVMIWIHGGSLTRGSGSAPAYDGSHFAEKGIVLVTINYRLNVFGYFAHPELSAEQGGHSGNYGTLDQIRALRWVRDNIHAFGGDPDNVTIAGQSAGGWAVSHLMSSPLSKGLFHKAIGQSGANMGEIADLKGEHGAETQSGLALQRVTGAEDLAALRDLDASSLLDAYADHPVAASGAIVDGKVILEQPQILFREGRFNPVDSLIGFNKDEASVFAPYIGVPASREEWRRTAESMVAELAADYMKTYGGVLDEQGIEAAYLAGWRDSEFGWHMRFWARSLRSSGKATYHYYFTRIPPTEWGRSLGSFHAAEIGYIFATTVPDTALDKRLSRYMLAYWSNFVRSGDPNGKDLPDWPQFGIDENYLELGEAISLTKAKDKKRFDFWDNMLIID